MSLLSVRLLPAFLVFNDVDRSRWLAILLFPILLTGCQSSQLEARPWLSESGMTDQASTLIQSASAASVSSNIPSVGKPEGSWLDLLHPMFERARALVEAELDIDLQHIRLRLVDDDPINAEVARETRRLVEAQFGPSEFSERFLAKVMRAQAGTYAALFTTRLNAVMVSRNMLANYEESLPRNREIRSAALLTLLIHELVHAADDQRYRIHEKRALNFRASFAQSATFEGHAQWITRRICAANRCSIGLDALDDFMFSRESNPTPHSQPVEAISRNVLEYSYVEGERFIAALASRSNGRELIDSLLSSPPYDPIQILAPDSFPDNDRENRNQRLIRASRNIDHPWVKGGWIGVETSPLKGVNLRSDPSRRQAAVDGFTRLIDAMVAVQLYDRAKPAKSPVEVTLLHAESSRTAQLFAESLHQNTQLPGTTASDEPLRVRTGAGYAQSDMNAHVYRTTVPDSTTPYRTAVLVSGPYVVQIAGLVQNSGMLDDYGIRVLLNLQLDP